MSSLKNIKLNTPTFREIIPSSKKEILITPFKVGDEKVMLMAAESKDNKMIVDTIKRVVGNCVQGEEIQNLSSFDLEYLFLKIRSVSVGETADLLIDCVSCNTANEVKVDISKITVQGIEKFSTTVKISDELSFLMKLPEMESYINIDAADPNSILKFLGSNVSKVFYGEEVIDVGLNEIDDVVNILDQLTSSQFESLQNFVVSIPKVSMDINFKCKNCLVETNNKLEGLADFF